MQGTKIQISANEFVKAMQIGTCIDNNGDNHKFLNESGNYVYIDNIEVIEKTNLEGLSFNQGIFIRSSTFSEIRINDTIFKVHLIFEKCVVQKDIYIINNVAPLKLRIFSTEVGNDLVFVSSNADSEITISAGSTIKKFIQLYASLKKCEISEVECGIIHLPSIQESGTLMINDLKFNILQTFKGFTNLGYMRWDNLKPNPNAHIELYKALMGKWDLVDCNLSNVKLSIISSKITDAFYTNTQFPLKLISPIWPAGYPKEHEVLRDGYNQLKTLAQKQNDRKTYLHFQAAELRSFYKTLHWWYNFRTKFQLGSMRISNNYGTSWGLGFLFVIIANAIFVSAAYWDRNPLRNWEGVGNYFSAYLSSIFSLISVPTYFKGSWEVNWFYFSRLFIAFGIYQTIAAFRKFGKSE